MQNSDQNQSLMAEKQFTKSLKKYFYVTPNCEKSQITSSFPIDKIKQNYNCNDVLHNPVTIETGKNKNAEVKCCNLSGVRQNFATNTNNVESNVQDNLAVLQGVATGDGASVSSNNISDNKVVHRLSGDSNTCYICSTSDTINCTSLPPLHQHESTRSLYDDYTHLSHVSYTNEEGHLTEDYISPSNTIGTSISRVKSSSEFKHPFTIKSSRKKVYQMFLAALISTLAFLPACQGK